MSTCTRLLPLEAAAIHHTAHATQGWQVVGVDLAQSSSLPEEASLVRAHDHRVLPEAAAASEPGLRPVCACMQ